MSNVVTAIPSLSHNTGDVFQSSGPTLYCGVENDRNNQINKKSAILAGACEDPPDANVFVRIAKRSHRLNG